MKKSLRGTSKAYDMNENLKDEYSITLFNKRYPLLSKNFTGYVNKTTKGGKTLINKILSSNNVDKEEYIKSVSSVLNLNVEPVNIAVNDKNINYDTMILKNQKSDKVPDDPSNLYEKAQITKTNDEADADNEEYEKELEKIRRAQAYNEFVAKQKQAQQQQPQAQPQPQLKFAKGGKVKGASHENGGVKMKVHGHNKDIEVEGGEYVINKEAVKHFEPELTKINKIGLELRKDKNNDKRENIKKKITEMKTKKNEYDKFLSKVKNTTEYAKGELVNLRKILKKNPEVKEEYYNMFKELSLNNKRKFYNDEPELFKKYSMPYIRQYQDDAVVRELLRNGADLSKHAIYYFNGRYGYEYGKKEQEEEQQKQQEQAQQKQLDTKYETEQALSNAILADVPASYNQNDNQNVNQMTEKIEGHDISDDGLKDLVNKKLPFLQKYVDMYTSKEGDFSAIMKHYIGNNKITAINIFRKEIMTMLNKLNYIDSLDIGKLKQLVLSTNDNIIKNLYFNLKALEKCKEIYDKQNKKTLDTNTMEKGNTQKGAVIAVKAFGGNVKASDVASNINKNNGQLNIEDLEQPPEQKEPLYKITNQGQKNTASFNDLAVNKNVVTTPMEQPDTVKRRTFDLSTAYYLVNDRYQGRYAKEIMHEDEFKNSLRFRIKRDEKKGRKNLS
jgi:hypothetical protein